MSETPRTVHPRRPPPVASLADVLEGLHQLVVSDEGDQSVLGRPDLGRFVTVPRPGGVLVQVLQESGDLRLATRAATEAAGQDVDGTDFIEQLTTLGLLAPPAQAVAATVQHRWVSPRLAGAFFGRVAWSVYGAAAVASAAAMLAVPELRPTYADVWFTQDKALATLVVSVLAMVLGGVHELWHWLCGRALGLTATFRISRRGIFLVLETDLSEVVTLPRARRNGVYLAGMAIDAVILAGALGAQWLVFATDVGPPPLVGHVAAAIAFLKALGIVQQWALVFLRSDVYALLANVLGCHNLYRATWLTTKRRVLGLGGVERQELDRISEHDRRVAGWFGWVHLAGVSAVGVVAVGWIVPYLVHMVGWLVPVIAGADVTSSTFWTAAALLLVTAVMWLGPAVVAIRERRLIRAGLLR